MIIIVHNDAEEDSVRRELEIIRLLRGHVRPIHHIIEDTPWIKTYWANEKYL